MIIGNSTGFNESQIWSRNYYSNNVVYTLGYYPKMLPQITLWSLFRTMCNCMHLFTCLALEFFGQRTKKTQLPDCVRFDMHSMCLCFDFLDQKGVRVYLGIVMILVFCLFVCFNACQCISVFFTQKFLETQ